MGPGNFLWAASLVSGSKHIPGLATSSPEVLVNGTAVGNRTPHPRECCCPMDAVRLRQTLIHPTSRIYKITLVSHHSWNPHKSPVFKGALANFFIITNMPLSCFKASQVQDASQKRPTDFLQVAALLLEALLLFLGTLTPT